MIKSIIYLLIFLVSAICCCSCVSSRKNDRSLEGLMLQENTKLRINQAYYSHHNMKARKDVNRKTKKYVRN